MEGYDAFHNVLCEGRRGGGLSVYISNVFKSKVTHPCTLSLPTIETLFIETVKKKCWLLFISIYWNPIANAILFIDKLSELLSIISGNSYDEIILCGDFNLDILNYDNNENTLNLLNSLSSQSLIPIITKPSLITNQTATLMCFRYSYIWYIWSSSIIYSKTNPVYKKVFSTKCKCEI